MGSDVNLAPLQRLPARALVSCGATPPHDPSVAILLDRLFRGIHPDDYRYFPAVASSMDRNGDASPSPASGLHSDKAGAVALENRSGRVQSLRTLTDETVHAARELASTCRIEQCQVIIAITGLKSFLPAAALGARLAKVPLILWIWDGWHAQALGPFPQGIVNVLAPQIINAAAAIVAPHELLADAIARRDGVRPVVIRSPVDDAVLAGDAGDHRGKKWRRIVFAGQISPAMGDAVSHLLTALKKPDLRDVKLHYYGPQTAAELGAIGIAGSIVVHPTPAAPEIPAELRKADALFLPLPFRGSQQELIYAPSTELADYLASGCPVLIHSPPGSFPAWYARRHECGLVVDAPDLSALAQAIRLLRSDADFCRRLGENGLARARLDFAASRARYDLAQLLHRVVRSV